jgi:hypothetical protein
MPAETSYTPDTNYIGRTNIIHPSVETEHGDAVVAAAEARARTELSNRLSVTVTDGTINKGAS